MFLDPNLRSDERLNILCTSLQHLFKCFRVRVRVRVGVRIRIRVAIRVRERT
jgi:hypothetical protein